jgi:hypothetical protein
MALTQVQPGMLTGNNPAIPTSTAVGNQALNSNSGANNTAVGSQAGFTNSTGAKNTFVGARAGLVATGSNNTIVGEEAGLVLSTGTGNTFVGAYNPAQGGCGEQITTGSKNTIIGAYTGNQGSLDIRTASNYVVLSDGDGNPHAFKGPSTFGYVDSWVLGTGGTGTSGTGTFYLNGSSASGWQPNILARGNGTAYWEVGTKGWQEGTSSTFLQCKNAGFGGGVYLNGSGATSWTSASDERLKENLVEITDAASKVSTLRAVIGNYTWDEEKTRRPFLIAQDVQAVLPEAVSTSPSETLGEELGVSYTEVIPLLVAAIKEQQAIITDLKARIETLEAK